jgi:DNA mismatch repair protein MutS
MRSSDHENYQATDECVVPPPEVKAPEQSCRPVSILDRTQIEPHAEIGADRSAMLHDLNLDQFFDALIARAPDCALGDILHRPLTTVEAIEYRHQVLRDLENDAVLQCVQEFVDQMRVMRAKISGIDKMYDDLQKRRWLLHGIEVYCAAIPALTDMLGSLDLDSQGMTELRRYVQDYSRSDNFMTLAAGARALVSDLAGIDYAIIIKSHGFTVRDYADEADYSVEVAAFFDKFRQGDVDDHTARFRSSESMNHIEAKMLQFVSRLNQDIFERLNRFCRDHAEFVDPTIAQFDREVKFYMTYLSEIAPLKQAGLKFDIPVVSATDKAVSACSTFDIVLAKKRIATNDSVVTNDCMIGGKERLLIVSGPNQGGKTTFARTFGQLHYLAGLGLPVPGEGLRLYLCDSILTHFEREELSKNLDGKLQDDLRRIHHILNVATPSSVVILNEIFNSTTADDAAILARKILEKLVTLDLLCVCVTFLDELLEVSDTTVSLVSMVVPDNPAERTFRVERRPADGKSYAISIAEKYRLTYEDIRLRLPDRGHDRNARAAQAKYNDR